MAWINLIHSNSARCAKLGLVRVQNSYIDAASAQVFAPGLFGGFSFRGLKKLKGVQNTVKRNLRSEDFARTLRSESFFTWANLVLRPASWAGESPGIILKTNGPLLFLLIDNWCYEIIIVPGPRTKAFSRETACPTIYQSAWLCWIVSLSYHI